MKCSFYLILFLLALHSLPLAAKSQWQLSPTVGGFYNGTTFADDVVGMGLLAGLEYRPKTDHFFSLELRTKYGYYVFDDGSNSSTDSEGVYVPPTNSNPRLTYKLFSPQIGLVPKLYFLSDDELSLFLENELIIGLMMGKFKYAPVEHPTDERSFTDRVVAYGVAVGLDIKLETCSVCFSIGYSTLNFRSSIRKHQPLNNPVSIPNQNAGLTGSVVFKFPLSRK